MSVVQRFRTKPIEVDMIRWDGTDEAWQAIANHGGLPERCPDGSLNIWVHRICGESNVAYRGWAVIEADGSGVYPCTAEDQERDYEEIGVSS